MCFGFLFNSERLQFNSERNSVISEQLQFNSERNEMHSERIVLKLAFFAIRKAKV